MKFGVYYKKDGQVVKFYSGYNQEATVAAYAAAVLIGDDAWIENN